MPRESHRAGLLTDLDRIIRRLAVSVQQYPRRAEDTCARRYAA